MYDYGVVAAALLRVHPSNFKIIGFTQTVSLRELVELAERHNLILLDDLGSGCLLETGQFGLDHEPMIQGLRMALRECKIALIS